MDNYGYIYITTNISNGMIYIGQHKSEKYDNKYYGSGKYFLRAFKKLGKDNFMNSVLCWCSDKEELDEQEKFFIWLYNSTDNNVGYNITKGGPFGHLSGYTKKDSDEVRRKMSLAKKGKRHSDEWKRLASDRMSGSRNHRFGKPGTNLGKKFTEEHINKIANSNRGSKRTDEQRKRISDAHKGQKISDENLKALVKSNQKPVLVYKDNVLVGEWESVNKCFDGFVSGIGISKKKFLNKLRHGVPIYDPSKNYNTTPVEKINQLIEMDRYSFYFKTR